MNTAMMTERPTAPTFYDFLLEALHKLGPDTAHQCKTVIPVVLSLSPYELDSFGTNTQGGSQVQSWIMTAWRECRQKGWGDNEKKGWWTITPDGITRLQDQGILPPPDVSDLPPVQATPLPEDFEAGPGEVLVLNLTPHPAALSAYHSDPYIRSLAIEATPCYGRYEARSTACSSCALSAACQQAYGLLLITLATSLEADEVMALEAAEDARKKEQARLLVAEANKKLGMVTPSTSASDVDVDDLLDDLLGAVTKKTKVGPRSIQLNTEFIVTCDGCGKDIPKGVSAMYDPQGGFFHHECCTTKD